MGTISQRKLRLYLGIDVGGTKIQVSAIDEAGVILGSVRTPTPRDVEPQKVVEVIAQTIEQTLTEIGRTTSEISGIGIAIPGVVDPRNGKVVKTPNMNLSGLPISSDLQQRFDIPVFLGNDCNLGALGESWLGSARGSRTAVAMLIGTGIGGGLVRKGKILRGAREVAGELGHLILDVNAILEERGPVCGCGFRGCFETLASRTAIERQIREAVEAGETTILTQLQGDDLSVIKSSILRAALEANDPLVSRVVTRAAKVLGYGCLTIRHLFDPEVIVLGGGVIVSCADWFMPIIEQIVSQDPMPGAHPGGRVLISALGDDAVVCGGVALAMTKLGHSPFGKRSRIRLPYYPSLTWSPEGGLLVDGLLVESAAYIRADGVMKKLDKDKDKKDKKKKKKAEAALSETADVPSPQSSSSPSEGKKSDAETDDAERENGKSTESSNPFDPKYVVRVCRSGPEVVFLGTGAAGGVAVPASAERYFQQRAIRVVKLPTPELVEEYNRAGCRRSAIIPHEVAKE
ncbi:MAG: ROK family protein [Thermoguttaceae bacterium]|nr:ROK family protein [Thermoguttaceae bacterium]